MNDNIPQALAMIGDLIEFLIVSVVMTLGALLQLAVGEAARTLRRRRLGR
ncbi:MAG: hypothetical protein HZB46_00635 [Solirubrobacterales bacterium]|nr:hypothetical protein [Solirubrobacterales bacterium]